MQTNPFSEQYAKLTNTNLFEIIHNATNYELIAVQAAKEEIKKRQLKEEEIVELKANAEATDKGKLYQASINQIESMGSTLIDTISPYTTKKHTTDRFIKLICLFFIGLFIYQLFDGFSLISLIFSRPMVKWDFSVVLYFAPLLVLPIATILFWLKKKLGWTLLSIYLTYIGITILFSFILQTKNQSSTIPTLKFISPQAVTLVQFIFYFGLLTAICRKQIRNLYRINQKHMVLSVTIIGAIVTFLWWNLLIR